jgi:predicted dehydrogenase
VKQVFQNRSGLTVVRDVPLPPCPPGAVLVRNAFSAISSGTERTSVESGQKSLVAKARERPDLVKQTVERAVREGVRSTREQVRRKLEEETATGYSSAGRVLEVGPRVRGIEVGDLVACAGAGHANHAEVVAIPGNLCARIPAGVPLPSAAMTTLGAIALHGVRVSGVTIGERVAVIGCGLIGQIACRLLRSAGAEVIAIDIDEEKVQSAVAGGANHGITVGDGTPGAVRELTAGQGVDHALVTAGAPTNDPLVLGAEILRDRGALTLVGAVPISFPRTHLYMKELTFRVSRSYGPGRYDQEYEERGLDYPIGFVRWTEQRNMEAVLALQASGSLTLEDLIDEVIPVDRAAEAYARITGGPEQRPKGALVLAYPEGSDEQILRRIASSNGSRPARHGDIAVGFVGCGQFASQVLVPAFVAAGAKLELVGGGSGPSAEAATRRLGFSRYAASESAVIEDPAVDAVVIGTRHESHAKLVEEALKAGKSVFCEKPLALSVEELDAVTAAATAAHGVLAVGFNRRFAPMAARMREFVGNGTEPLTSTYRVSAGAIPSSSWVHDLEQGGGRVLGEVCHFIDTLVFLAASPVIDVHASGLSDTDAPAQARDNVAVTLRHANGSLGTILYVARSAPGVEKERIEAFGRGGAAVLDDYRTLSLHGTRQETIRSRAQDKGHRAEVAAFVQGVRNGSYPVPLSELSNVSLATIAVVRSMLSGLPVRLEG